MSDTPRTDARVMVMQIAGGNHEVVFASIAREMERELNVRKGDPVTRLHNICEALTVEDDARVEHFRQALVKVRAHCSHQPWTGPGTLVGLLDSIARIADAALADRQPVGQIPGGVRAIAAERERQMTAEGWTPEHDDEHKDFALSRAALAYIEHAVEQGPAPRRVSKHIEDAIGSRWWPWDWSWWKPKDTRRNLVRAGALIAAEIERLDRLRGEPPESPPKMGEQQ